MRLLLPALLLAAVSSCRHSHKTTIHADALQISNEQFVEYMKRYLDEGYRVRMVPKGNSMLPTLKNGEEVVTLVRCDTVRKGEIVLALTTYGHYVIHRVVSVKGEKATLKGDHNKTTETAILGNVLARLVNVEPKSVMAAAKPVAKVGENARYQANPHFRIDRVDSLAWMVDTLAKEIDMHRAVVFNEAALSVWEGVGDNCFSLHDMVGALTQVYDVDTLTAFNDCRRLLAEWLDCELVVSTATDERGSGKTPTRP